MADTGNLVNEVRRVEIDWLPEDIHTLTTMWADGATQTRIGEVIGRSREAVGGQIHRLGLPKKGGFDEWPDEATETLKAMWLDGESTKAIADTLGRSRGAVASKVDRLKLPRRRQVSGAAAPKAAFKQRVLVKRLRIHPNQAPVVVTHAVYEGTAYEAPATRKTLLELGPHDCRWPCGDPGTEGFFFCGAAQAKGYPYCNQHSAIAYAPTPRLVSARVRYNEAVAA